jgi:hypothetical protein
VTAIAQPGVDPAQLPIGSLVGVKRSNGSVTVARVTAPAPETPPGQVHVTLEEGGAWKEVTTDMLFTLPVLANVERIANVQGIASSSPCASFLKLRVFSSDSRCLPK